MKGLHILKLAIKEFHTLIQGGGHDGQSLIGGPSQEEGLFLNQGLFARGQRFLLKGFWQLIQGLLILLRGSRFQHSPESGPDGDFVSLREWLARLLTLTFIGGHLWS